jgi:hypothetical protein
MGERVEAWIQRDGMTYELSVESSKASIRMDGATVWSGHADEIVNCKTIPSDVLKDLLSMIGDPQ